VSFTIHYLCSYTCRENKAICIQYIHWSGASALEIVCTRTTMGEKKDSEESYLSSTPHCTAFDWPSRPLTSQTIWILGRCIQRVQLKRTQREGLCIYERIVTHVVADRFYSLHRASLYTLYRHTTTTLNALNGTRINPQGLCLSSLQNE